MPAGAGWAFAGIYLRAGKWRRLGCRQKARNRSASDVLDTQRLAPRRWDDGLRCGMGLRELAVREEERRRE